MSLDELLKDNSSSAEWRKQRSQLFRIVFGVALITLAAIGIIFMLNSMKKEAAPQDGDVEALTELMSLRREAASLKADLDRLVEDKKAAQSKQPLRKVASVNRQLRSSGQSSRLKLVSYEPGEAFVNLKQEGPGLYIPTGAVFQARLITPIKTSVAKTFVIAETTHEFRMDMQRRIPKGSRLIGRSRLNPVLKGVIVEFDTLVLPKGIETPLSGLALSRNALPEIDGLYFSDKLQTYGTALAFGFLSGFADAAKEREVTILGSQATPSINNQVLAGLSTASFQVAEDILNDVRESAVEYVVVPAGEPIFVALTRRYQIENEGESQ